MPLIYWGEDASPSQGTEWKTLGDGESVTIAQYGYTEGTWTTKQESMLYGASSDLRYWMTSRDTYLNSSYVSFGVRKVDRGNIAVCWIFHSSCSADEDFAGVRPTVYLKSDIQLSYNSETEVYTIIE